MNEKCEFQRWLRLIFLSKEFRDKEDQSEGVKGEAGDRCGQKCTKSDTYSWS